MAGRPRIRFRKPRPEQQQAENASGAATKQAPTGSEKPATQPPSAQQPSAAGAPAAGAQAAGSAITTPKGAAGATNASKADGDPQERIDALRAWVAGSHQQLRVRT